MAGITTEKTVEFVGKKAVDSFLNSHQQALMLKQQILTKLSKQIPVITAELVSPATKDLTRKTLS